MADATIVITINPFTDSFADPDQNAASVSIKNFPPVCFGLVANSGMESRFTIVQPVGTPGQSGYVPGSITVNPPGQGNSKSLSIGLQVVSVTNGVTTSYTECGLAFAWVSQPLSSGQPARTGRDNFPSYTVDTGGLVVQDSDAFGSTYEFLVMFQNAYGAIGVVDPRIINSP